METLVAVAHHRNHHQYDGRNRRHGSLGSTGTGNMQGINCRSFQSGVGLLPTPIKSCSTPLTKKAFSASPKTPTSSGIDNHRSLKRSARSCASPIPININFDNTDGEFHFYERWAGPAYSNSPPPSSLPIPKFSMHPKRTVSLELPKSTTKFDFHPIAKSAPASPRERSPSPGDLFDSSEFATKTLRRILNLDVTDE